MAALLFLALSGLFAVGTAAAAVSPEGGAVLCAVWTMLTVTALKRLLRRRTGR